MTKKIKAEDVYTDEVGNLLDEANISRSPLDFEHTLDLIAQNGVGSDSLVLDVGCANGGVSRQVIERTGCDIEGVEMLDSLINLGNEQNSKLKLDGKFRIQKGLITKLPFDDNTFDFVLCHDVIGMVEDLDKALDECRRVLKPGGKIMIYASFATDRLTEKEETFLNDSLGNAVDGLKGRRAEELIEQKFVSVIKEVIGSQYVQRRVEQQKDTSEAVKGLLQVARLLTWSDFYKKKYGETVYSICLAEAHWSTYILLGKLSPTIFIGQKP